MTDVEALERISLAVDHDDDTAEVRLALIRGILRTLDADRAIESRRVLIHKLRVMAAGWKSEAKFRATSASAAESGALVRCQDALLRELDEAQREPG